MITEPVFILAGQSNMAGRCIAADLPPEYCCGSTTETKRTTAACSIPTLSSYGGVDFSMCWNNDSNFVNAGTSDDQWLPLQCQLAPGLDNQSMFGPEFGIAATLGPRLAERGLHKARFLKFAMGSTNLHSNWNPENNATASSATVADGIVIKPSEVGHYARFIEYCRRHLVDSTDSSNASNTNRKLMGMFWLQGESDSSRARDANAYLDNLERFITAVRRDLDCRNLFVVVSPVVWKNGKKVRQVNQALQEAGAGVVERCSCIPELEHIDGFGVQPREAGPCAGHLTAASTCEIGRRMGLAMPLQGLDDLLC